MNAPVQAAAVQPGWTIHIGPHDIYHHTRDPIHRDIPEADVTIKDKICAGTIVVFYWGDVSTLCGAVVYDRDDVVERVA